MNKKDFLNIIKKIESEKDFEWRGFFRGGFYKENEFAKELKKLDIVVKEEDQVGGEGQGDYYYWIFSVQKGEEKTYFKLEAIYQSHYGVEVYDYYDFFQVKQVPVEILEWQAYEPN